MSQEIEIEFKNMLTKSEYIALLEHFQLTYEQIAAQHNHYFDTADGALKKQLSGLRIRETIDRVVCTLKERNGEHSHLETTDVLTPEIAKKMLQSELFDAPEVEKRLQLLEVNPQALSLIGTLHTKRVEIELDGDLLVLDHSFYLNCDDYEVEYETTDEIEGAKKFQQFLATHAIPIRPADKKIARFMKALQQK